VTSASHLLHEFLSMNALSSFARSGLVFALVCSSQAAEPASMSAKDLAAKLSELRQDGTSYVRLRMEIKGATTQTLQLQIKQRRTKGATDVLYQVLFPKERKGEAVLLRKSGSRGASGSTFTPPDQVKTIGDLKDTLFGGDLAYEDVIEDFFAWDQQSLGGTEQVQGVTCQVLESKPGKARSIYASVKSWIDLRRMVPMRVEKYSGSGKLVRRIETTRVVTESGQAIPANLVVQSGRQGATDLDGSRMKRDVAYTDKDFSAEGMKDVSVPRGAPE